MNNAIYLIGLQEQVFLTTTLGPFDGHELLLCSSDIVKSCTVCS